MGKQCKYYNQYTWVEPPLEEGDYGTPHTEFDCTNAKGYFVATCDGKKKNCNLKDKPEHIKLSL